MDVTQLRASGVTVLIPGDDDYEVSLQRWTATAEKRASIICKPKTAEDVRSSIQFARTNHVPLTACGGGHSSSGTSSTEGMVIDLSDMRAVSVDQEAMTVTFEGGCLWKDLEEALDPLGLATVGGVVNHTGVGGLILGGGHGYLTPQHGLTIDNLISVQVVTADGSILEANAKQNEDLFWAMRGAGAQFGIVTRFVSSIHEQGPVWSGAFVYSSDRLPQIVEAGNHFHDLDSKGGHCMTVGIGFAPDGSRSITVTPFFNGPESEGRTFFQKLLDAGPMEDKTSMMKMGQVNTLLNPLSYHGIRRLMGSGNAVMPLDTQRFQNTADKFWDFCEKTGVGAQSAIAIELFPTHKIREVGLTETAYANRGDYYDAVTMWGWEDKGLDEVVRGFNREMVRYIREELGYSVGGRENGKGQDGTGEGRPVGRYINLETDPVRPEDAYGVNLERLREVKRRWDPDNIFNKWHGVY